jgi:hypothetical protein
MLYGGLLEPPSNATKPTQTITQAQTTVDRSEAAAMLGPEIPVSSRIGCCQATVHSTIQEVEGA